MVASSNDEASLMEEFDMPTESLIVVAGVFAAFAFFSVIVIYGDLTWNRAAKTPGRKKA